VANRIVVYGVTGSGKTVLAERISAATGIPWHAIDELTWEPGWSEVPLEEQRRRVSAICAGDRWILDTAYGRWLDIPLAHADLVVALDFPRRISLARLVRRTFVRVARQVAACNGNLESLHRIFSRDSIIVWHFKSFARKRERIRRWELEPGPPSVVRLTSPRHVERWLESLAGP
jgi:adenylate kinase family enzyme